MKLVGRMVVVVAVLALGASACGSSGSSSPPTSGTIKVPADYDTIQAAVDAAQPGSLILVSPGTYHEAVKVTKDNLVIRGTDRNKVILDGQFKLDNGVQILDAKGVAVENMTAENYKSNGFFWTGVTGYRGSYLTAIRNGDYGVYAYGSVNGVIEHSYGEGSPDAGVYIGQCYQCHSVIDDFTSEWNGLGYSGTNSGGDLTIMNSSFRHNRVGAAPNTGSYEGCAPEYDNTIVGNIFSDNGNSKTDGIDDALEADGNGLIISGGRKNVVMHNRADNNPVAGIAITPYPEDNPIAPLRTHPPDNCTEDQVPVSDAAAANLPNPEVWHANDNRVTHNTAMGNGHWDLALIETGEKNNCFSDNDASTTSPANLQQVAPCDGAVQPFSLLSADYVQALDDQASPAHDYKHVQIPDPGPLKNMPNASSAPVKIPGRPSTPDVSSIQTPPAPSDS